MWHVDSVGPGAVGLDGGSRLLLLLLLLLWIVREFLIVEKEQEANELGQRKWILRFHLPRTLYATAGEGPAYSYSNREK